MEFFSRSLRETNKAAGHFLARLSPRPGGATVVGLRGELGSGKTTFVQAVGRLLHLKEKITSPTFVIIKTYDLRFCAYRKLVHVDAYRLKDSGELKKLRWLEITGDQKNLVFVEWPEHVRNVLPAGTIFIDFEFLDETSRKIILPRSLILAGHPRQQG